MKKFIKKLLFSSSAIILSPLFFISCYQNEATRLYQEAQKYYKIRDFLKNPFDDLFDQQSDYAKDIAKFLDQNYQWTQQDKLKFKDDKLPDQQYFDKILAEIVEWKDGDTVILKSLNSEKLPQLFSVRLESIDTPETGMINKDGKYEKTSGVEAKFANKATEFAKKILPVKAKVYFVFHKTGPSRSYERYVGSIFFGHDEFYKNYSLEIVKAGLAAPILHSGFSAINDPTTIYSYLSIKQASALENAINKKFGVFEGIKDKKFNSITHVLEEIWKTRGLPPISNFLVLGDKNKNKNVVDWYEFGRELKEKK